ncbi:MAG: Re/Si-specific NAD(P)(+) transhydrogenase subunit alpha [Bryobacteraceae bacterium]|nr:Re/Si-specific NAD(P)(+) transhydrogenase subunit alpha [Bryobacteraceae bacterium]
MTVGVLKETWPGERRVALVPQAAAQLVQKGLAVAVEAGAGAAAGFRDEEYEAKGARVAPSREEVIQASDVIVSVRASAEGLRRGQTVIGFFDPLSEPARAREFAAAGVSAFAIELMPRITRAQSMDALSSMATVAGYEAVILAASHLPRLFPMLMTAAGTIAPAHVYVVGVGVAGLQAIATARRLGAVVSAYDVRPAVKEQVQSLGAKFVELPLEAGEAEDRGGYARAMDENFYRRQRELMARVVAENDVVITTAAVPGRKAPVLITEEMVKGMAPGSVLVDLAIERGGNCELTVAGEVVERHGVTIIGLLNLPSRAPYHASQMYARNIANFLLHIAKQGSIDFSGDDEILRETLVTHEGAVVHGRVRELLGEA